MAAAYGLQHGDLDLEAAARIVLRDWAYNNFPYYSVPPILTSKLELANRPDMQAVLAKCKGRKEMRRDNAKGLIRFQGGAVDKREVSAEISHDEQAELSGTGCA